MKISNWMLAVLLVVFGTLPAAASFNANAATVNDFLTTGLVTEAQARRIVIFRGSFGPFNNTDWLSLVPGIDLGVAQTLSELDRLPRFGASPPPVDLETRSCFDQSVDFAAVLDQVASEDPELASLFGKNPPTPEILSETLKDLTPKGTRVLEYLINGNEVVVWILTAEGVKGFRWTVPAPGVEALLAQLWVGFENQKSMPNSGKLLEKLYTWLVEPIAGELGPEKSLVYIVSDGPLYYLPFHALIDGNGEYLVEKYTFAYVPTAATLEFSLVKGIKSSGRFRGLGNPELQGLEPLPFTEREIQEAGRLFSEPTIYFGSEATKRRGMEAPGVGGIIHYATHAILDADSPSSSAIMLSSEGSGNGALRFDEIAELDFSRSSLAVLSACRTNVDARTPDGREIVALSRSFLYAGTSAVLASQWSVHDEATSYLIRYFYRHVSAGMNKADALAQAQRDMIGSGLYEHPVYWAAFQLMGDYR